MSLNNIRHFLGRKLSTEHRQKISKSKKGTVFSQESKRKMSEFHKGKKLSRETRQKMSTNNPRYWLNKKLSEEHKQKMSESHIGLQARENHPNWKGGIAPTRFKNPLWKKIVTKIRKRDNYTCLYCKRIPAYNIHHMLPVRLGGMDNEDNLVTLCRSCHAFIERKIIG